LREGEGVTTGVTISLVPGRGPMLGTEMIEEPWGKSFSMARAA